MKSFISAASVVPSTLSISLLVSAQPTDASSGHLNVEREIRYLQNFGVAYGDSPSEVTSYNIMQEINEKSNDFNHVFSGE